LIGRNKQGADLPRHEQLGHESWGFIMTIMIIIVTIITISLEETQDLINHQSSIINQQSTRVNAFAGGSNSEKLKPQIHLIIIS
jgi:hypothetical protein